MLKLFGLVSAIAMMVAPIAAIAEGILTPGEIQSVPADQMRDPKTSDAARVHAAAEATKQWEAEGARTNEATRAEVMKWSVAPVQLYCNGKKVKFDQVACRTP